MAKESGIVKEHLPGAAMQWELGRARIVWYLWVGWHIPPGSWPLVFIQKAVLAGTVRPGMKYSSLNTEGTEAQCLKKRQKCSGVPVATPQRTTSLLNLSISNVVLFKCFESVILLRILSPFPTPLLPSLGLFASKREASELRHGHPSTSQTKSPPVSSLLSMASFSSDQAMGRGTTVLIYC